MHRDLCKLALVSASMIGCLLLAGLAAAANKHIDPIKWEELKEKAIEYGRYNGRFVTCDMKPPYSFKVGFLKYARSQGASDKHLDILAKVFDEGQGRVRGLDKGFSPAECKEKLESDEVKKILQTVEEWNKLP